MYRDDEITELDFTDDKGTGSHKVHSEVTDITGKKCIGDCEGSGKSELHSVVIREWDNTYDIEVIFPNCVGTGNCKEDGIYEADPLGVTVSNHPLGTNKDVLTGTKSVTAELPGGLGTATSTFSWHFVRSKNQVELIVTPQEYDSWMPEPGKNELTAGKIMNIDLKLVTGSGLSLKTKAKSFELHLSNTSEEPGMTLNAPQEPISDLPDLGFMPPGAPQIGGAAQEITVPCPGGCNTASVKLGSFDGGGWTTLTATAILEDGTRVEGHLITSGGVTEIPIPKRDPNLKIASAWLQANGDPGEMDDKETSKDNPHNGDGLTAYEEYRGVISEGKFKRLDPQKKELGVWMNRAEYPLFEIGLDWFENASEVKVIKFFNNEIGPDRKLNKNAGSAHSYDQYALRLLKGHVRKNVLGRTEPGPGIPSAVKRVIIDYNQIVSMQQKTEREALQQHVQLPYSLPEMIAKTVAHELGHGVNIWHHGDGEIKTSKIRIEKDMPVHIYYPRGSAEITDRPYTIEGVIGDLFNQESGDIFCLMNYNPCYDWSQKIGNNGTYYFIVPLMPIGNQFCDSTAGTDINEPIKGAILYFGDCLPGRGNCLEKIKLRN